MRNNSSSAFSIIIKLILISVFLSFITNAMGFVGNMAFLVISAVIPSLIIAAIVLAIIAIIKGGNDKPKANYTEDLLKLFNKTSFDDNKVVIDDESYLLLTDLNNIQLGTIDIFMNNEYIGNLSEFSGSYPNSYNSLCSKLIKANKKKKKKKETVQEIVEPIKETVIEKDCQFYIRKFHELDSQIETESVKESIKETIGYLEEIKKIEDEFGDSKKKTYKLYEYYLPMYADILANYDRLHDNAPQSAEFKENETKLIKTSQLINSALKSVSSSLTESYYTDLNVNMKTLESILKKDGLVEEQMEAK